LGGDDLKVVKRQLGKDIYNFRRVIRRCSRGFPVVIESFPEKEGKPFPTLHWLTCPYLRKGVSKLESNGWIKKFEEMVQKDKDFRKSLIKAHLQVKEKREKLTKDEAIRALLKNVGSGGIRDLTKVKCLHLHLADFLAGVDNPIGRVVWEMIEEKECTNLPKECDSISKDYGR